MWKIYLPMMLAGAVAMVLSAIFAEVRNRFREVMLFGIVLLFISLISMGIGQEQDRILWYVAALFSFFMGRNGKHGGKRNNVTLRIGVGNSYFFNRIAICLCRYPEFAPKLPVHLQHQFNFILNQGSLVHFGPLRILQLTGETEFNP